MTEECKQPNWEQVVKLCSNKIQEKYPEYGNKWLEKEVQEKGSKTAKKFPNWGRSVGANISEMQSVLGDFEINEDYCGESCQVD